MSYYIVRTPNQDSKHLHNFFIRNSHFTPILQLTIFKGVKNMKTNNFSRLNITLAIVLLVLAVSACAFSAVNAQEFNIAATTSVAADVQVEEADLADISTEPVEAILSSTSLAIGAADVLSQTEINGLLFMREEEKLARDVYLYLHQLWGSQVFSNIAQSEESHTQAVLALLDRYDLEDPAAAVAGEFANPDLQALYEQLIAQGSQSLKAALQVGAAIEEIDILDLQDNIEKTAQADILQVYQNLLNGSSNHLQAFVRNLSNQTGESYQPQYLTQEAFDEIIVSPRGNGQRGRWGSGGN
jgi:hypothetical protein